MNVTFLVLAHQRPAQLATLLDALVAEGDRAVVHVDASVDESSFRRATQPLGPSVTFCERRHHVRWGGFGIVAGTLATLRQAVDSSPADHYVLLSGSDFPVKPISDLHRELTGGAVRMNCWPMPDVRRGKPMSRLEHRYYAPRNRSSRLAGQLNRVLSHLPKRNVAKALGAAQPHAGSQWWSLPHDCAVQVLAYVDQHPGFVDFFRRVQVPDEIFFQTVVMDLPQRWDVRANLTYTRWTSDERLSPDELTSADVTSLADVGAFFARKFDSDRDPEVLARVREELLTR